MGRVTLKLFKSIGMDPCASGLERFIPQKGISPLEFIRLPIEQHLSEARGNPPAREKVFLLTRRNILSPKQLHWLGVFAARLVLPVYEKKFPDEELLRKAVETKERWLRGHATDLELERARIALWSTSWEARAALSASALNSSGVWRSAWDASYSASRALENRGNHRLWENILVYTEAMLERPGKYHKTNPGGFQ